MKLRARLLVTTAALTIPVAAVVMWAEADARARAVQEILVGHVESRLAGNGRHRCERDPDAFARPRPRLPPPFPPPEGPPEGPPFGPPDGPPMGPPPMRGPLGLGPDGGPLGPPIDVIPYDETLQSSVPDAPKLSVKAPVDKEIVRLRFQEKNVDVDAVLVRTPWGSGKCAFVLARRPRPPFAPGPMTFARAWILPVLAAFAAIMLVAAPLVRRIRKLARQVRSSAKQGYAEPIDAQGDDEIAELAKSFEAAGREVRTQIETQRARERTLRDFLANTTHDVMTPLTVLQGQLATMRAIVAEGRTVDPAIVGAAIDEAHYMASLVHNLGVAARLEGGEPNLARHRFDLGALINRAVSRHRTIAKQHAIEIEGAVPDQPILIDGDETFVEQAIGNVIYNAIRYNKPGGHVAVVLSREPKMRFRIRVLDDGPGIPEAELARVAERNVRGEGARTRNPDGRGLGLSIARKVAELHDFTMTLGRSEYGGLQVDFEGARTDPTAPTLPKVAPVADEKDAER